MGRRGARQLADPGLRRARRMTPRAGAVARQLSDLVKDSRHRLSASTASSRSTWITASCSSRSRLVASALANWSRRVWIALARSRAACAAGPAVSPQGEQLRRERRPADLGRLAGGRELGEDVCMNDHIGGAAGFDQLQGRGVHSQRHGGNIRRAALQHCRVVVPALELHAEEARQSGPHGARLLDHPDVAKCGQNGDGVGRDGLNVMLGDEVPGRDAGISGRSMRQTRLSVAWAMRGSARKSSSGRSASSIGG